ncbi:hypothetical protein [Paludisphaera rhizosphaerae]|uniref:hypothetical protein n=1 Tax=Paludisphaera rhizosphaerae TaxID=2711216 RepID=UPI0013ECACD3|nr:hypothetical protein [Paludisphaera rhizosphaerae]
MALTIADIYGGASGGWTLQDGFSYTVEVQVEAEVDDPPPGPLAIMQATGLAWNATYRYPLTGTALETDVRAKLLAVDVQPTAEDGRTYKATIRFGRYSSNQEAVDPDTGVRDPFAEPPSLRNRGEEQEVAVAYDRNGDPVLNSADDPFEDSPTIPASVRVYEIGRLQKTFDDSIAEALEWHVNDAEWLGWPAGSVLCRSITADRTWNSDTSSWAWDTSYVFAIRKPIVIVDGGDDVTVLPGWTLRLLDCGFRELDGSNPNKQILDKTGAPVSSPVPLDGSGAKLAVGADPVYKSFDVYPEADFSVLDFPSDLFSAGTP